MIIKNGYVYENDTFIHKDLFVKEDLFTTESEDSETIDASGCYVIPGLTDLHFHGCMGHDFCEASTESLDTICQYEASIGVTTICPATMTLPVNQLEKICNEFLQYENDNGALLCGIHLEGPFLSKEKKGAQNPAYLKKADLSLFQKLQKSSGNLVKLITVAPEFPENMDFIQQVKDEVRISLGHTTASYDVALQAFQQGASHVTHLFNAMPPFHHRDPGVIGAAFDSPDTTVEIICDGIHLHPSMIRTVFSMFTKERIILISDSMEATGMPNGTYSLGGQQVTVSGNSATLSDGTLAGSVTNLMDCVRYLVKQVNIPLATAIRCAAVNPAKAIGIYEKYGSLDIGKIANFVLLKENLDLHSVYIRGKKVF